MNFGGGCDRANTRRMARVALHVVLRRTGLRVPDDSNVPQGVGLGRIDDDSADENRYTDVVRRRGDRLPAARSAIGSMSVEFSGQMTSCGALVFPDRTSAAQHLGLAHMVVEHGPSLAHCVQPISRDAALNKCNGRAWNTAVRLPHQLAVERPP